MPPYDEQRFSPPAPVATVTLRHPDRPSGVADVPMLIDSGADVTLVPQAAITLTGAAVTGERYQLIAFDGTTSEAEAVRVDLVFLGRRFRGRFLVSDAEIGVLGRDVLNHVRLLLNGLALSWDEWPASNPVG